MSEVPRYGGGGMARRRGPDSTSAAVRARLTQSVAVFFGDRQNPDAGRGEGRKEAREERTVRVEEVFARVLSGPTDEARSTRLGHTRSVLNTLVASASVLNTLGIVLDTLGSVFNTLRECSLAPPTRHAARASPVQGYLAHKKPPPPRDPTVGLFLGS